MAATLRRHDLALYAGGLTFYAAIAVVPLLLLGVYLSGLLLGAERVVTLGVRLVAYVPDRLELRAIVTTLFEVGPRLAPLAVVAALLPATTYGEGLARAFDRLGEADDGRPALRGRLRALPLVASLPLVVMAGLFAVTVLPGGLGLGQGARALGIYATFWVGWVSSALLVAVVYRAFAPGPLGALALGWGAASTGSFLSGMSLGWVLVLSLDLEFARAYAGSDAITTAVLASLYLFCVQLVVLVEYVLTLQLAVRAGHPLAGKLPAAEQPEAIAAAVRS